MSDQTLPTEADPPAPPAFGPAPDAETAKEQREFLPTLFRPALALRRIVVWGLFTLALAPLQAVAVALRSPAANRIPHWYHVRGCRLLGLKLRIEGKPSPDRPTLFVANHASYLDILVLSATTDLSFVAKSEVASWPFFGLLAELQRTVFVDRRRSSTGGQRDAIAARLAEGGRLVLIAEGTSNDGNRVKPFKRALFSVGETADGRPAATIQPVSIAYTRLDGVPIGRALRPLYAWYGDMELGGHLWRFAGLGETEVVVRFHPPLAPDAGLRRRDMASSTHRMVAGGVSDLIAGREITEPEPAAAS